MAGLMTIGTAARAAEDIEPVDAEFLEYLGTLEEDDSNWTVLEDAESKPKAAATSQADSTQTVRAKKPEPSNKSSKEAAQPAAEKR